MNGKYDGVTMREALQWFGEHGLILQKVPDGWACAWDKNRFTLQSDPYDCIYEAWVSAQKPPETPPGYDLNDKGELVLWKNCE